LWSAPGPRRAKWVVEFSASADDAPTLDDVDSDIFKRPVADLDLPIGMVIARIYIVVNDANSTLDELQSMAKVIEFFLLGAAPSGLMKRVGVTRLRRLMAKFATALRKGELDTARSVLRRIADYLNDAAPDSIF
jgi:hypothetical protein